MKLNKKSKYNLSDGEEDELDIPGVGSFSDKDDFEDEVPFDDDEDGEFTETGSMTAFLIILPYPMLLDSKQMSQADSLIIIIVCD